MSTIESVYGVNILRYFDVNFRLSAEANNSPAVKTTAMILSTLQLCSIADITNLVIGVLPSLLAITAVSYSCPVCFSKL